MRLFIHIDTGMERLCDDDGAEFTDLASAQAAAIQTARKLLLRRVWGRLIMPAWFIEIVDANGQLVKVVSMASILLGTSQFDRYRGLYEAAPHPYLLLTPELTIIEANPAYQRAIMIDIESIHGCYMVDIFPDKPNDPSAGGVLNLSRLGRSTAPDGRLNGGSRAPTRAPLP